MTAQADYPKHTSFADSKCRAALIATGIMLSSTRDAPGARERVSDALNTFCNPTEHWLVGDHLVSPAAMGIVIMVDIKNQHDSASPMPGEAFML